MTEKQFKTLDAVLRLFTAQNWAYTPQTLAKWIYVHTNTHVTEEQVSEYFRQGLDKEK